MKPLLTTFFVSVLLVGCANGRLRIGTPPVNGIISAVENTYPEKPSSMVSSWPYATLHTEGDVFQYLEKYCQNKKAILENPLPAAGWCITPEMYPLFIFYSDATGGLAIREKSTDTEDKDWINYTKEEFGALWYGVSL
ncbi:hypothetical protein B5C26_14475 [Photorhabdus luminescens]|uniref:Lipoprotein n=1 Tax=Photorhabdus luminescens subsp. mexicana TaxID=2100167 RepID=A0A4R4JNL5_PHOLU|nr:hypothetical protein [Photorhabdus luminescens]OWO81385.1 hypothetical protein B5C26_14475 [Photorhabdus luminescens]TDB56097.1 hypothetical protein C5468_02485 [Photorhabdus luminescens subsp. mexicana]